MAYPWVLGGIHNSWVKEIEKEKETKMGVASLVLGIVALIVAWIPCVGVYALLFSVLGLILGAVGIAKAKKTGQGKGLSVAGLVCNIIATVIAAIWFFVMAKSASAMDDFSKEFNKAVQEANAKAQSAAAAAEKAAAEAPKK